MHTPASRGCAGRRIHFAILLSLLAVGGGFGQDAHGPAAPASVKPTEQKTSAAALPEGFPTRRIFPPCPSFESASAEKDGAKDKDSKPDSASGAGAKASAPKDPSLFDALCGDDPLGLKSLFDSLHLPPDGKAKKWYEKLNFSGYSQIRYGRTLDRDSNGAAPFLLGDRSINGKTESFSIRRARLLMRENVNEYFTFQCQVDLANNPADNTTNTFFAQIRDLYGDIYLDKEKVNRIRVGQSKIPWGFEEMQSSGNRVPLDRSEAIDSGDSPNQRDLGVFYYWTPKDKQKLLDELVSGGLKGTGNYGIFAFGAYNGQGGSQLDQNNSLHTLARFTWPFRLPSGQVVEMSIQGYTGQIVVAGTNIYPTGQSASIVPAGAGGNRGLLEQRVCGSFVWYPQPFGFQTEWNFGQGPGLNDAQTAVQVRSLEGGYVMAMYKVDTEKRGVFIPYTRYQHYRGGYRSIANSPYGTHDELDFGVEWQINKGLELVVEYDLVDGVNLLAVDTPGATSYGNFRGSVLRCQLQLNY